MSDEYWYVIFIGALALLALLAAGAALDLVIDGWAGRGQRRPTRYPTAAGVAERSSQVTAWLWLPVLAYVSAGVLTVGLDLLLSDARGAGALGPFLDAASDMPTPFGAPVRGLWVLVGGLVLIEAVAILAARPRSRGRSGPWRHVENWGVLRETLRRADDAEVTSRSWRTEALVARRHLRATGGRGVRRQRRALALIRTVQEGRAGECHREPRTSLVGWTWSRVPWSAVARWSPRRLTSLLNITTQLLLAVVAACSAAQVVEYDGGALRLLCLVVVLGVSLGTHASWARLDLLLQARAGARREVLERDVELLLDSTARRARAAVARDAAVLLRVGRFTVQRRGVGWV